MLTTIPYDEQWEILDNGKNVTKNFVTGAELAYNICMYLGIKVAILKENSPSCGVNEIYDGTFTHKLKKGSGITASYLKRKGLRVISENDIESFLAEEK